MYILLLCPHFIYLTDLGVSAAVADDPLLFPLLPHSAQLCSCKESTQGAGGCEEGTVKAWEMIHGTITLIFCLDLYLCTQIKTLNSFA